MSAAPVKGTATRTENHSTSAPKAQADFDSYLRELADQAAETGISNALSADLDQWSDEALGWICSLEAGTEFDADDLRASCSPAPTPALIGAVFRRAAVRGVIEPVDFVRSQSPTRHNSFIRRWRVVV
jgi:hypothetical protein